MPGQRCLSVPMAVNNMASQRLLWIRGFHCPGLLCCQELSMAAFVFLHLQKTVLSPASAGSHGFTAVEECAAGVLRSLGEGGQASAGCAEVGIRTKASQPWGSTGTRRARRNT